MSWRNTEGIPVKKYCCGYCGIFQSSIIGFQSPGMRSYIYICSNCEKPTYITKSGIQIPDVAPGNNVKNLPEEIESLYNEARNCVSVSAYTASVLTCRKLLMNIAVNEGAAVGESFISYVQHLADNGFVPPNGKGWVDHIRRRGNEANHEIALMTKDNAEELIIFAEMLLKFIYEFPAKIPPAEVIE